MLILENYLDLKSKQADVNAAFLHVTLEEDEKVYVEMPLGFKQCSSNRKIKVLCLKKTLLVCVKVLVPFGNILLRSLEIVVYLKLLMTPVSLLVEKSLQSVMLMI